MERVSFDLEFIFRASPTILYNFLTDSSCLSRWFSEKVDVQEKVFTFTWEGTEEVAHLIESVENERLRFQWEEAEGENEYFEYRMSKSPITGETIMLITDFCDADEIDDQTQYWNSLMKALKSAAGG